MTYRICRKCKITHIDNCGTCFGFGVYAGEVEPIVPITAGDAHALKIPANWQPCPECKSTPAGVSPEMLLLYW